MVTTKYSLIHPYRKQSKAENKNGYNDVYYTCTPKTRLKTSQQTYRNRLLRCIVLYINTISKNHKRGSLTVL
ncbi:unnamed protein product [Tenebrio molitor]|nr:unnamed protein product [Tenebrio molitor]